MSRRAILYSLRLSSAWISHLLVAISPDWPTEGEICAHRPRTEGEVSSADPVPGPSEETTWAANATHRNTRFSVSFSTRSIWEVTVQLAFRARGSIRGHRMRTEGVSNGNLLTSAICPLASGCNHICKRAYLCQFPQLLSLAFIW